MLMEITSIRDILRCGKDACTYHVYLRLGRQEYSEIYHLGSPVLNWSSMDMEIFTIHHDFDNIPEAAFLVKVDGLVIYPFRRPWQHGRSHQSCF